MTCLQALPCHTGDVIDQSHWPVRSRANVSKVSPNWVHCATTQSAQTVHFITVPKRSKCLVQSELLSQQHDENSQK